MSKTQKRNDDVRTDTVDVIRKDRTQEQRAFVAEYRAICGSGILVEVTKASYETYGDYPPYTDGSPEGRAEIARMGRGYYERSAVYVRTTDVYDDDWKDENARGWGAGRIRAFTEDPEDLTDLRALLRACTGREATLDRLADFKPSLLVGRRFLADTWKDYVHEIGGQIGSLHTFSFAGDTRYTFARPWLPDIWIETLAFIAAVPEDVEREFQARLSANRAEVANHARPSGGPAIEGFVVIPLEALHPISQLLPQTTQNGAKDDQN